MPRWLSQLSVQLLVSAHIMISWLLKSSPVLGSLLSVQILLGILSPFLSAIPLLALSLSLKINFKKVKFKKKEEGVLCKSILPYYPSRRRIGFSLPSATNEPMRDGHNLAKEKLLYYTWNSRFTEWSYFVFCFYLVIPTPNMGF